MWWGGKLADRVLGLPIAGGDGFLGRLAPQPIRLAGRAASMLLTVGRRATLSILLTGDTAGLLVTAVRCSSKATLRTSSGTQASSPD